MVWLLKALCLLFPVVSKESNPKTWQNMLLPCLDLEYQNRTTFFVIRLFIPYRLSVITVYLVKYNTAQPQETFFTFKENENIIVSSFHNTHQLHRKRHVMPWVKVWVTSQIFRILWIWTAVMNCFTFEGKDDRHLQVVIPKQRNFRFDEPVLGGENQRQ